MRNRTKARGFASKQGKIRSLRFQTLLGNLFTSKRSFFALGVIALILVGAFSFHNFNVSANGYEYTEDFYTNTYKDAVNTTARWNNQLGKAALMNEVWSRIDESMVGSEIATPTADAIVRSEGGYNTFDIDSTGNVHIAWTNTANELIYTKWNGTAWVDEVVVGADAYAASIDIDASDRPHIAWESSLDSETHYTYWDGAVWQVTPNVTGSTFGFYSKIIVKNGLTHVAWTDGVTVQYSYWDGVSWNTLSSCSDVAYDNEADCLAATETWTANVIAVGIPGGVVNYFDFAIDSNDAPHFVYLDFTSQFFYKLWNVDSWNVVNGADEYVTTGSVIDARITLDANDSPHIVFNQDDAPDDTLRYVNWNEVGLTWDVLNATEVVTTTGPSFQVRGLDIVLDSTESPHVVFYDSSSVGKYLYWDGVSWTGKQDSVDQLSTLGNVNGLSLRMLNDDAYVVYYDNTTLYATRSTTKYFHEGLKKYYTDGVAQSLTIDQTADNILRATLSAEEMGTGTITYELSADGGSNWCAAALNAEIDFTTCNGDVRGSDLRWRATLTTVSTAVTPEIKRLSVTYQTKAITITSPNGGEDYVVDSVNTVNADVAITWNAFTPESDPISTVNIYYSSLNSSCTDNQHLNLGTGNYSHTNDGHEVWDLNSVAPGNYYICIRDAADATVDDSSNATFVVYDTLLATFDFNTPADYTVSANTAVEGGVFHSTRAVPPFIGVNGKELLSFDYADRGKFTYSDPKAIEITEQGFVRLAGYGGNHAYNGQRIFGISDTLNIVYCWDFDDAGQMTDCGAPFPLSLDVSGIEIQVLENGNVLIPITNGVHCLDATRGYEPCAGDNVVGGELSNVDFTTYAIQQDQYDRVWFLSTGNLVRCLTLPDFGICSDPALDVQGDFDIPTDTAPNTTNSLAIDQRGYMWVGVNQRNGVVCIDTNVSPLAYCDDGVGGVIDDTFGFISTGDASVSGVESIEIDVLGNVWVLGALSFDTDVVCLDASNGYNQCAGSPFSVTGAGTITNPSGIDFTPDGRVWVTTNNGAAVNVCIDVLNNFSNCQIEDYTNYTFASSGLPHAINNYFIGFGDDIGTLDSYLLDLGTFAGIGEFINDVFLNDVSIGQYHPLISSNFNTTQYQWITTTDETNYDISAWETLVPSTVFEQQQPSISGVVDAQARFLFSFDGRVTWKYHDGVEWQPTTLSSANFASFGETHPLPSFDAVGGFDPDTTQTIDVAIGLSTDNSRYTPIVRELNVDRMSKYEFWDTVTTTVPVPYQTLSSLDVVTTESNTASDMFVTLSNNGTDFYYWDATWQLVTGPFDYLNTTLTEAKQNIGTFSTDVGPGNLYVQLVSQNGYDYFTEIESINVGYEDLLVTAYEITDSSYTPIPTSITIGGNLYFQVAEWAFNTNPLVAQTISGVITSTLGDSEAITLTESATNSGVFRYGPLPTASGVAIINNGTLQVTAGNTITMTAGLADTILDDFEGYGNAVAMNTAWDTFVPSEVNTPTLETDNTQYIQKSIPDTNLYGGAFAYEMTNQDLSSGFDIDVRMSDSTALNATGSNFDTSICGAIPTPLKNFTILVGNLSGPLATCAFTNLSITELSAAQVSPVDGSFSTVSLTTGDFSAYLLPGVDWSSIDFVGIFVATNDGIGTGASSIVSLDNFVIPGQTDQDSITVAAAPSGGGGGNAGQSVSSVNPYDVIPHENSLEYVFKDLSNDPNTTSYKIYNAGADITNTTGFTKDFSNNTTTGIFQESGLQPNTQYSGRTVTALNGTNESPAVGFGSNYTLANVPGAPAVSVVDDTTLKLIIDLNGNPDYTRFKVLETTTNQYLLPNGQLVDVTSSDFFNYAAWGGVAGVSIPNLVTDQTYNFVVQALNEDEIATVFGAGTSQQPAYVPHPVITAEIKVGINQSRGTVAGAFFGGILDAFKFEVQAGNGTNEIVTNTQSIFNFVLAFLLMTLLVAIYTIFMSLEKTLEIKNKLSLVPSIMKREASEFFGEFAAKAPNGMYEYSFAQHKRLHRLSRISLFTSLGVVGAKIALVMAVAVFGIGSKGSMAQFDTFNGNGAAVNPGDVISYAVLITNDGDAPAQNVVVSLGNISPAVSVNLGSAQMNLDGSISNNAVVNGNTLTIADGNLAPNATGYALYSVTVAGNASLGTQITQSATISSSNHNNVVTNEVSNVVGNVSQTPLTLTSTLATTDSTPTLTGTGEAGTTVTVSINGAVAGTAIVAQNGTWSFTPSTPLADGTYTLLITDSLGRTAGPYSLVVNAVPDEVVIPQPPTEPTTPPTPPTTPPTTPTEPSTPGTGSPRDPINVTSPLRSETTSPAIYGTGEAGATIRIALNGRVIGETVVDANGNWTLPLSQQIQEGTYVLVATDVEGNQSRIYTLQIELPIEIIPEVIPQKSFLDQLDDAVDAQVPFLEQPEIEQATQQVFVPGILALSAAFTLPAIFAGAFNILPYLHLLFMEPLAALFGRRKGKYGVIYNALSKVPIDLAVVRLYNATTKALVSTKITDKNGRYYLLVSPGEYYLSVSKPGFIYPTQYLREDKQDLSFTDLYHGEKIAVTQEGTPITANIPLDPKEVPAHSDKLEVRKYLSQKAKVALSMSGIWITAVALIIYPTALIAGFLVMHIALYSLFRRIAAKRVPKSWGVVLDEESKEPLKHAVVRIFDTRFNKLLETAVTDGSGRYSFLVGQNVYQVVSSKQGYMDKKSELMDLTKEENSTIAKDFTLKHGEGVATITYESAQPVHEHKEIHADEEVKDIDLGNL